jgi:hypothetical protein
VDNVKMDLGVTEWGCVDWIGLAQDWNRWRALVIAVMNLLVPKNVERLSRDCTTGDLLSDAQIH